jgi:hypothetical protein
MDGVTLLRRAREAGLRVAADSDKLVIRGPKNAAPVARLLIEHKPAVKAALAADWGARHREALAHWGALRAADEAAWLAWGELQDRWHRLHGARAPEWQCAGCGEPVGGLAALTLADGNRVHLHKLDCLLRFGKRWRSEAAAGLEALGLVPPTGCDP